MCWWLGGMLHEWGRQAKPYAIKASSFFTLIGKWQKAEEKEQHSCTLLWAKGHASCQTGCYLKTLGKSLELVTVPLLTISGTLTSLWLYTAYSTTPQASQLLMTDIYAAWLQMAMRLTTWLHPPWWPCAAHPHGSCVPCGSSRGIQVAQGSRKSPCLHATAGAAHESDKKSYLHCSQHDLLSSSPRHTWAGLTREVLHMFKDKVISI